MGDKVYKQITVTGCSDESYKQAVEAAIAKAAYMPNGWIRLTQVHTGSVK